MKEGDVVAGRYRLLRPIGAGAMGTVWAVSHELLGRDLALKLCTAKHTTRASREARDLFLREVRIVGKLKHPNVVDIADAGEADGGLYLAMELLEGESLAQRIAAGPLPVAEALAIAAEVCRGLAAAHAAGVIHRDLKPENIFLARGVTGGIVPKLLDFGVSSARHVTTLHRESEKLFGTPAYMSPEQALGEDVDCLTDVWSLGVVLHEMLTGHLPFQAASYPALLPLIIESPAPPLPASVPAEARAVVAGCLAKNRKERFSSAVALLQATERALEALPSPGPASTRTGFFIETQAPLSRAGVQAAPAPDPPNGRLGRTARAGLAAVVAVPLAIGAAITMGSRAAPGRAAAATANTLPPAPAPEIAQEIGSRTGNGPAPTATAVSEVSREIGNGSGSGTGELAPTASSSMAPSGRPRLRPPAGGGRKVTKVNTAGF